MNSIVGSGAILIVDDNPENLEVLSEALTIAGFKVAIAVDGESAIKQIKYRPPELILLDIMMPGIDGFETCQRLKADPTTQDIPIIFMTALSETESKVKGLSLGAVDYITKPFQQTEVIARVKTHIQARTCAKTLQEQNQLLQQEVDQRQKAETALKQANQELEATLERLKQTQVQMIQSEKMFALGQLVAGIAHEINNPVSFIYGNIAHADQYVQDLLELLSLYRKKCYEQPIEIQEKEATIDLDFLMHDLPKLLFSMKIGAERIRQIVTSLRTFSRMDESEMKPVNIHDGIDSTLTILQSRFKANSSHNEIEIIKEYSNLPRIECYAGQLNQVFMNILANALDALEERDLTAQSSKKSWIRIRTEMTDKNQVLIRISDNGTGIKEQVKQRLFDPFFTTKPVGKGTGLGLSISYKIIVEQHGGELSCNSVPGEGTEFAIAIPARQTAAGNPPVFDDDQNPTNQNLTSIDPLENL